MVVVVGGGVASPQNTGDPNLATRGNVVSGVKRRAQSASTLNDAEGFLDKKRRLNMSGRVDDIDPDTAGTSIDNIPEILGH